MNAEKFFTLGNEQFEQQRYREAIIYYDGVTSQKKNKFTVSAWYNKGLAYAKLRKINEAEKCYDEALAYNPKYTLAWNNKGIINYKKGEFSEALRCYNEILKIKPDDANTYDNIGNIYYQQGEYDKALDAYKKSLEKNSKFCHALYHKGQVYLRKNEIKKAKEYFTKALEYAVRKDIGGEPIFIEKIALRCIVQGANLNYSDNEGNNLLHIAAKNKFFRTFSLLLYFRCDYTKENKEKKNLLKF